MQNYGGYCYMIQIRVLPVYTFVGQVRLGQVDRDHLQYHGATQTASAHA